MLKKVFYSNGIVLAPSSGALAGYLLKEDDRIFVPSAKGLDDEGLKLSEMEMIKILSQMTLVQQTHYRGQLQGAGPE